MEERLNELAQQKQTLIRLLDGDQINQEKYDQEITEIEQEINNIIKKEINDIKENPKPGTTFIKEEQKENINKPEQIKRGRKTHKNSTNSLIIKALKQEDIKDIDQAVDKIKEWKPELDSDKILLQIRVVISLVKHGNGNRWKKYRWNKEQFLLEEND